MQTITVGRARQFVALVSDEDYEFLRQWLWTYAISHKHGDLVYVRRSIRVRDECGSHNVTILMHRVVLTECMGIAPPTPRHTVHHGDGSGLNNQRWNLGWRSPAGQMAENRLRYARDAGQLDAPIGDIPFD
jgi:hypothetical protein